MYFTGMTDPIEYSKLYATNNSMLWCKNDGYTSTADTIFIVFTVPDLKMATSSFESRLLKKTARHSNNCYFSLSSDREKRSKLHKSWVTDGRKEKSVCAINDLPPADYFVVISLSAFQFEKKNWLRCIYSMSITRNAQQCTAAWLLPRASAAKHKGSLQLKRKKIILPVYCDVFIFSIFHFLFLIFPVEWDTWAWKGAGEAGGKRQQLEWGDSLIRGDHADETYLGRPCVRRAPKVPVLKHWLAVSAVFSPRLAKGCRPFIWYKQREGGGSVGKGKGVIVSVFCFFFFFCSLFFSMWGDGLQTEALSAW